MQCVLIWNEFQWISDCSGRLSIQCSMKRKTIVWLWLQVREKNFTTNPRQSIMEGILHEKYCDMYIVVVNASFVCIHRSRKEFMLPVSLGDHRTHICCGISPYFLDGGPSDCSQVSLPVFTEQYHFVGTFSKKFPSTVILNVIDVMDGWKPVSYFLFSAVNINACFMGSAQQNSGRVRQELMRW